MKTAQHIQSRPYWINWYRQILKIIMLTTTLTSFFVSTRSRNVGRNDWGTGWWSASLMPRRRGIKRSMLLVKLLWKILTEVTKTTPLYSRRWPLIYFQIICQPIRVRSTGDNFLLPYMVGYKVPPLICILWVTICWISQFMLVIERVVEANNRKSSAILNERKKEMSFEVYKRLCEELYKGRGEDYLFVHALFTME